ncbi:TRAP transporter substrate-binding protein [Modicisalibacter tunisiensis]|uniref:TRAP transporter substrate-binding protein n=1 Tax=Modicisalibacter tunisiensis TaxID=390637 RepID=A0ABS7WVI0_9GAMM|nr:TRAP transporter substrate-binding protein [Modicisalibacter tunisiensis]MBZ9566370.1 TRAP transporter substrate-binding protein [Modicisalibacter tunisiensis]
MISNKTQNFSNSRAIKTCAFTTLIATFSMAHASEKLDVASAYSTQNIFGQSAENISKRLDDISGGDFQFTVHDPGDLVPPFEIFSSVSSGAIPAGWTSIAYLSGTLPIANLYGALPFSPSADAVFSWTTAGEGSKLLQKALDPYNVKFLACSYLPQEPGGWFNKEINSTDDLKGLSMRISGLGAKVLNQFGASTQLIPGNEVYLSLERGRVDAAEFSIPQVDHAMGLDEIAKYYYFPGWQQGAGWLALLINQSVWDGYSDARRAQITTACQANIQKEADEVIPAQVDTIRELKKNGVEIRRFPDDVLQALHGAWVDVRDEEMASSPAFAEAYNSLMKHAEKMQQWHDLQALGDVTKEQGQ